MAGRKVMFIIPGFRQKASNRAYKHISLILRKQGYWPLLVDIPWANSTISENCEYFLNVYKKLNFRDKYILGFSYGAMIAFIAASKVRTSGLILCSLSPFFAEDLPKHKKAKSVLMQERYEDFAQFHSGKLAKKLKTKKVLMMYGSHEAKTLINRVTETFDNIPSKRKQLIRISKIEHEIGHKRYLQVIHQAAKEL